jgi:hypothetical protein
MLKKPIITPTRPWHAGTCLSPSFVLASDLRPWLRKDASHRVVVGWVSCQGFLNILGVSSGFSLVLPFTFLMYNNGSSSVG